MSSEPVANKCDGMIGDVAAVFDARCYRIAEVIPDEDAWEPLVCCLTAPRSSGMPRLVSGSVLLG